MGKAGVFSLFHSLAFARVDHTLSLVFAKTGKEVAYAGDIFVSDAVNVPIEGPCVRERWTRSKEFEKVRGKQVCSRHCV